MSEEEKEKPLPATPCRRVRRARAQLVARVHKWEETRKHVLNPDAYRKPGSMRLR